ncbi:pertactin-like passenger domain-containing protein [Sporomusa silvacetica]|uniref:pertactin-like passenger domain-containing protein n=1 Tax=Sporomusa silvacetica TaxID=55504 RepID=UPI00146D39F8|nr:pertactin-like passenger domain-containing protein [Sporomusa silvacetica]
MYTSTSDYIKSLILDGGIINLTWDNTTRTSYRTLTIGSLSGSGGTVKINTDLTNDTGDTVTITSAASTPAIKVAIAYDPIMKTMSGLGYHAVTSASSYTPVTAAAGVSLSGALSEYNAYSYIPEFTGSTITGLNLGVSSNTKAAASAASGFGIADPDKCQPPQKTPWRS